MTMLSTPEQNLWDITKAVKGDPECSYKTLTVESQESLDPDAPADSVVWMTTDAVDWDSEIVLPQGCDFRRFDKNPLLLLGHPQAQGPGVYHPLPIGRVPWKKVRPRGILGGIKFATTPMAREVQTLWDENCLKTVSVGFKPVEVSKLTREEAETRPDWYEAYIRTKGNVLVHRKWLLIELSIVPIPANEDALRVKFKGEQAPAWLKLPPLPESPVSLPALPTLTSLPSLPEVESMSSDIVAQEEAALGGDEQVTEAVEVKSLDGGGDGGTESVIDSAPTIAKAAAAVPVDDEQVPDGSFSVGDHVDIASGGCGTIKTLDDAGTATVDLHDSKCAMTGNLKSCKCADMTIKGAAETKSVEVAVEEGDDEDSASSKCPECVEHGGKPEKKDAEEAATSAKSAEVPALTAPDNFQGKWTVTDLSSPPLGNVVVAELPPLPAKAMSATSLVSGGAMVAPETADTESEEMVYDEADDSEDALPIKTNDYVEVKAPHYKGYGLVKSVHTRGHVPHVDEDIRATPEYPAVRVKCFKTMGDGFKATEDHVGARMAHCTKCGPLMGPSKKAAVAVVKPKPKATAPGPPLGNVAQPKAAGVASGDPIVAAPGPQPLPPLIPMSRDEVFAEYAEKLARITDPEYHKQIHREQLLDVLGAIRRR